jgi:excisionase family DNA binding protein
MFEFEAPAPPRRAAYPMQEAAELLGVSRSHVYALAERGQLRLVRIGRRTVVPASEIARLLSGDDGEAE